MASEIQINGADGYQYILVRPDTYEGPQAPETPSDNESWAQWLRSRFSPGFTMESLQWQGILQAHGVSLNVVSNRDLLFRRVAEMLTEGRLAIYRVPVNKLPPAQGAATGDGGGSDSARTGQAGASASTSAAAPEAAPKAADTGDPGASTSEMQCQGDPIAPVSGEEILDIEDFVIHGPMPLHWIRRYRSGYCNRQLGLGAGWAMPGLRRIVLDQDRLTIVDNEARSLAMDPLKPGEITWQVHTGLRVERRRDNRFILTEADGRAWILATRDNKTWWPVSVQNLLGLQWRFHYDAEARLVGVQLSADTRIVLSYHKYHPDLVQAIDLENRGDKRSLARYSYDDQGNLVRAESDHGTEQYQYQGHLLIHRELPTGYSFHFEWQGQGPEARCLRSRGEPGPLRFPV